MRTHILTFSALPFVFITDVCLRTAVGTTLSLPEFLHGIRIEGVVEGFIAALAFALLEILFKPTRRLARGVMRRFHISLRWWPAETEKAELPKTDEDHERLYLGWLKADLTARSRPLHNPQIVATPAHEKKPMDPILREELRRLNTNDYRREPELKNVDLATRVRAGRGKRIENLAEELKRFRTVVVLGDPGSGKSVCLRRLASDLCDEGLARIERGERPRTLPVFVEMGKYEGWDDKEEGTPTAIIKFLTESLRGHTSVSDAPNTHSLIRISKRLEEILEAGRATVIFDALDELPQESYQERYIALKQFVVSHEGARSNRFVFSCRVLDYDSSFSVDEVVIERFDLKRIHTYLTINAPEIADELYDEIVKDKALEDLVGNPFFLHALTYVNRGAHARGEWVLPGTAGELIKQLADRLLEKDVGVKHKKYLASVNGGLDTLRSFLSELAFAIQEHREWRTVAPTEELGEVWERYPQWKLLLWIARRARILDKRDAHHAERDDKPDEWDEEIHSLVDEAPPDTEPPRLIEFRHHRLQEYFAAEELGKRLSSGAMVDRYLEDIWWQETVVFAIGVLPEPRPVIERMLSPRADVAKWFDDVMARAADPCAKGEVRADAEAV